MTDSRPLGATTGVFGDVHTETHRSRRGLKLTSEGGFQSVLQKSAFMAFVTIQTTKEQSSFNLVGIKKIKDFG